jgi:hypothetical protein
VASLRDSASDDPAPEDDAPEDDVTSPTAASLSSVPAGLGIDPSGVPTDLFHGPMDRHPTALGRHLDYYLAAVARELHTNGVLTGAPQRSSPAHRLIGSIVLDFTALRLAAWTSGDQTPASRPPGSRSLGHALHPERPSPVLATWDKDMGWCVGLHHDPTRSSRRYLHPDLLPAPQAVADFVVGLALGQTLVNTHPITPAGPDRPRLRLLP